MADQTEQFVLTEKDLMTMETARFHELAEAVGKMERRGALEAPLMVAQDGRDIATALGLNGATVTEIIRDRHSVTFRYK